MRKRFAFVAGNDVESFSIQFSDSAPDALPRFARALIRLLRKHRVGKAAMEASGGYEQDWAKALREARIYVAQPPTK